MSPSVRLNAEVSSGRRIRDYIGRSRSKNPYGHLQFRYLDEVEERKPQGIMSYAKKENQA
jgi:hypothetical protein